MLNLTREWRLQIFYFLSPHNKHNITFFTSSIFLFSLFLSLSHASKCAYKFSLVLEPPQSDDGYPCYLLIKHVLRGLGTPVETEKVLFSISLYVSLSLSLSHAHTTFGPQTVNSFFLSWPIYPPFINCFSCNAAFIVQQLVKERERIYFAQFFIFLW